MAGRTRTQVVVPRVRAGAWRWFAAGGAASIAVYFLVRQSLVQTGIYAALGFLAAGALVVGPRLHGAARTRCWTLLGAGVALWAVGDLVWSIHEAVTGTEPFPGPADVAYLAAYPVLVLGVACLVRGRRRYADVPAVLDSLAVTVAAALPAWMFLMAPMAADTTLSSSARVVAVAYPLADLLVLGVLVRLWLVPASRGPAYWLLIGGLLMNLVGDILYAVPAVAETYTTGSGLDVFYLGGYAMLGAAALHPNVRGLTVPSATSRSLSPQVRVALVGLAGLTAPVLLAIELLDGAVEHVPLLLVGWCVILVLVLVRLAGVMRQLTHEARIDPLTGLPNRALLMERVDTLLNRRTAEGDGIALLYLDLDGFKEVNDSVGHFGGDLLLIEVAERLRATIRPGDLVARLGGDEFVVLCRDIFDEPGARAIADRLAEALAEPFVIDDGTYFLTASIGISRVTSSLDESLSLLKAADTAMYRAKSTGKARAEVYDPSMRAARH